METVQDNYRYQIDMDAVAQQIRVTPNHLAKIFKNDVGLTFIQFLNKFRIEIAKKYVGDKLYSIYKIMEMTGFTTEQNFFKQFKKCTGKTPMEYVVHECIE